MATVTSAGVFTRTTAGGPVQRTIRVTLSFASGRASLPFRVLPIHAIAVLDHALGRCAPFFCSTAGRRSGSGPDDFERKVKSGGQVLQRPRLRQAAAPAVCCQVVHS
jgi:hypothetical protein